MTLAHRGPHDYPRKYRLHLKSLSDELLTLQKPIRILDAIKWPRHLQDRFLASGGRALPAIDRHFYDALPLGFDPRNKYLELKELRDRIRRKLGPGTILAGSCKRRSTSTWW